MATNRRDHSAFYSAACLVISACLPVCFSRAHTGGGGGGGGMWAWLFIHNGCHHTVRGGSFWMQGRAAMHTAHTVKYRPLPYETEGYAFFFFFNFREPSACCSEWFFFFLEHQVACTCRSAGYRVTSDESSNFYKGSRAWLEDFGERSTTPKLESLSDQAHTCAPSLGVKITHSHCSSVSSFESIL